MTATATAIRRSLMDVLHADGVLLTLIGGGEIAHRYTRKVVNIPSTGATITYYDNVSRDGYMPNITQTFFFDIWSRDLDRAEEVAARMQYLLDSYGVTADGGIPAFQGPPEINLTSMRAATDHDDNEPGSPEIQRKSLVYYLRGWDLQG